MIGVLAVTRVHLIAAAQYRVSALIWSTGSALQSVVYLMVWTTVATASGGSANGLGVQAYAGYFVALVIVREAVLTPMPYMVPQNIQSGTLAIHSIRPMHPLLAFAARAFAFKLQHLLIGILIAATIALTVGVRFESSAADVAAGIALLPLAMTTMLIVDSLFAMLGFWLVRIDGLRGIYLLGEVLLGGMLAPLAAYPEPARQVAELLPFWWAFGYPAQLLSGGAESAGASPLQAALVLACWSAVGWLLLQVVWPIGLRRDMAVGT